MAQTPADDPAPGHTPPTVTRRLGAGLRRAAHGTREVIRRNPTADRAYRAGVGVVGGGTVALGVVLMPLPGPGALVALGGLGILSTEFEGARKVSASATTLARRTAATVRDARARRRA